MKFIAIFVIAMLANIAVSANSVVVNGYGASRDEARQDAYKNAIEKHCGYSVLSERQHQNFTTRRNDVSVYSSCRVKRADVISQNVVDGYYELKYSIQLEPIRQSHRLLGHTNSSHSFVDVDLRSKLESYQNEKNDGDKLLSTVFSDYPYNAYNLHKVKNPYVIDDDYRNFYLVVPYKLTWNYNYIQAMNDTFSAMSTKKGSGYINITAKDPNKLIFGKNNLYYMNDLRRIDQIKDYMSGDNELRLKIEANDYQGKRVLNVCYSPDYRAGGIFYSIGLRQGVSIFGNDVHQGEIKIKLHFPVDVIYDVYVDVVADRDCKL